MNREYRFGIETIIDQSVKLYHNFYVLNFFKGGEPDLNSVAKIVLNDFQRGRLPYFVLPSGMEMKADEENDSPMVFYPLFISFVTTDAILIIEWTTLYMLMMF